VGVLRLTVSLASGRMERDLCASLERKRGRLAELSGVLRVLSPEATLARGYSITLDSEGAIIRSREAVKQGEKIRTRLADGSIDSRVL